MSIFRLAIGTCVLVAIYLSMNIDPSSAMLTMGSPKLYPENGATLVNADVKLRLTFSEPPKIGTSGKIRIIEAETGKIVDQLDLSIPAGPTKPIDPAVRAKDYIKTPYSYRRTSRATNRDTRPGLGSGGAADTIGDYQLTIIGGFTDGFHFYPITVDGNTATIHPHHDVLESGRRYFVEIDPGVLSTNSGFVGIPARTWSFETKFWSHTPREDAKILTVASDGSGDFDTVQGALDFVPDRSKKRITIKVKAGVYEELVYARNKDNVTIVGEGADRTIVRYANNEVFNPHPSNIRTNECPGTFPSRRAAVTIDNCNDFHIANITLQTTLRGQAEGLLINGERNILSNIKVIGSGDALQANGKIYAVDTTIIGDGDTILGRGMLFCERCTLRSTQVFMWPRNTEGVHGNIFKDSTFIGIGGEFNIARAPQNGQSSYPFAEVILLNSKMDGIAPEGWGNADMGGKVRFWEYNSRTLDGKLVDVSKRAAWSRQLDAVKDAKIIADYSRPKFVFGGWKPVLKMSK